MPITGSRLQIVAAATWVTCAAAAPLLHRVPTDGFWGSTLWLLLGALVAVSTVALFVLTALKLVGDALFPDWIDRWWDAR